MFVVDLFFALELRHCVGDAAENVLQNGPHKDADEVVVLKLHELFVQQTPNELVGVVHVLKDLHVNKHPADVVHGQLLLLDNVVWVLEPLLLQVLLHEVVPPPLDHLQLLVDVVDLVLAPGLAVGVLLSVDAKAVGVR